VKPLAKAIGWTDAGAPFALIGPVLMTTRRPWRRLGMALDPQIVEARISLRVAELKLLAAQTAVEFFAEGGTPRGLPPPSEADDQSQSSK
jgi:hypothetical protein